jgi:hypothetical protein
MMGLALVAGMSLSLAGGNARSATVPMRGKLTTIELKTCRPLKIHRDGGSWRCPGLPGYPVHVAEGDLRQYLGFGPAGESRASAKQTLVPFNSIFKGNSSRAIVEWRTDRRGGRDVPYATIMRWYTSIDGVNSEVVVVTRVTEKESCIAALIDAIANPQAIALARSFADLEARTGPCLAEPRRLGAEGKIPM